MDMDKLLTVVVPVYKVEKYINKCLDSLIVTEEQMKKLEVIVVNDGTPDNSAVMAKEYEERYPGTFKLIDKENGGHGSAWNKGVELATGKYLRFLDSDDWLENKNFELLIEKLNNCQADLVFTHRNRYYESSGEIVTDKISNIDFDKELQFDEYDLLGSNNGIEITNFWYCTYKTDLLKQLHPLFLEHIVFDDGILFVAPILVASTFVCYDMFIYNYLLGREGQSMDPRIQYRNLDHRMKVQKSMIDFVKTHPTDSAMKNKFITAVMKGNIGGFTNQICSLPSIDRNRLLKEWVPYVTDNLNQFASKTIKAYNVLPNVLFSLFLKVNKLKHLK